LINCLSAFIDDPALPDACGWFCIATAAASAASAASAAAAPGARQRQRRSRLLLLPALL